MGPTRLRLAKPVIAAVEGHAVAGGLELALWCDLRVAARDAVFGVYCRRWGVPLIDGGTVRLPRLIGQSRAMDMILSGRPVEGAEAEAWGLANRLTEPGGALDGALALAEQLAAFPQRCLRSTGRRPSSSGRSASGTRWRTRPSSAWPPSAPARPRRAPPASPPARAATASSDQQAVPAASDRSEALEPKDSTVRRRRRSTAGGAPVPGFARQVEQPVRRGVGGQPLEARRWPGW